MVKNIPSAYLTLSIDGKCLLCTGHITVLTKLPQLPHLFAKYFKAFCWYPLIWFIHQKVYKIPKPFHGSLGMSSERHNTWLTVLVAQPSHLPLFWPWCECYCNLVESCKLLGTAESSASWCLTGIWSKLCLNVVISHILKFNNRKYI